METRHLRYTQMISDGDCKSFATLNEHKPYGNVEVVKHECIGHVQKRVMPKVKLARTSFKSDKANTKKKEKALKDRMKEVEEQYGLGRGRGRGRRGGRGRSRGEGSGEPQVEGSGRGRGKGRGRGTGKGKGKMVEEEGEGEKKLRLLEVELSKLRVPEGQLLDVTIKVLQQYYGKAIHENTGHLERMTDACWAVFYHSLSTDSNPRHYCCPKGTDSWCKFQCALALGETPPDHHTTIPADYEEYLEPQWRSLCTPALLEKCVLGATQNCNESFNSLVWLRAPKTEFCSLATMKGAVGQAIIVFNSGKQALVKLMDQLRIPAGPLCSSYLGRADQDRVKRAGSKMEVVMKKRRQMAALRETRVEQQHIEEEGTTYLAGGFGGTPPTPLNRLFSKPLFLTRLFSKPPHPKIFTWGSECLSR